MHYKKNVSYDYYRLIPVLYCTHCVALVGMNVWVTQKSFFCDYDLQTMMNLGLTMYEKNNYRNMLSSRERLFGDYHFK